MGQTNLHVQLPDEDHVEENELDIYTFRYSSLDLAANTLGSPCCTLDLDSLSITSQNGTKRTDTTYERSKINNNIQINICTNKRGVGELSVQQLQVVTSHILKDLEQPISQLKDCSDLHCHQQQPWQLCPTLSAPGESGLASIQQRWHHSQPTSEFHEPNLSPSPVDKRRSTIKGRGQHVEKSHLSTKGPASPGSLNLGLQDWPGRSQKLLAQVNLHTTKHTTRSFNRAELLSNTNG